MLVWFVNHWATTGTLDVAHLSMYLFAICMSSLGNCLLSLLPIFWLFFFFFFHIDSMYLLGINPLSVTLSAYMFSHSVGCLLSFVDVFLGRAKASNFVHCTLDISQSLLVILLVIRIYSYILLLAPEIEKKKQTNHDFLIGNVRLSYMSFVLL